MKRFAVICLLVGLAIPAVLADLEGRPPAGVKVTYNYDRRNPGWCSFRLTLRNETKPRPLFIAGRNESGTMTVKFPSMEGVEEFEGVSGISDLVGTVETQSTAVIDAGQWSANWIGAEQFVGTAWLNQQQRPEMKVRIVDVTDWQQKTDEKRRPLDRDLFEAKMVFELHVGDKKIRLTRPVTARFRAPSSRGGKYAVRFSTDFSFQGSQLGLTGRDAGTIDAKMVIEGFSTFAGNTDEQLRKSLEDSEIPTLD
ncbi:MAG: hypothetical protein ACLFUJ_07430 [Phycisphaerae bacterium]